MPRRPAPRPGLKNLGLFILFGVNFKDELKGFCKEKKFTYLFGTKWKLKITLAFTFQNVSVPLQITCQDLKSPCNPSSA